MTVLVFAPASMLLVLLLLRLQQLKPLLIPRKKCDDGRT